MKVIDNVSSFFFVSGIMISLSSLLVYYDGNYFENSCGEKFGNCKQQVKLDVHFADYSCSNSGDKFRNFGNITLLNQNLGCEIQDSRIGSESCLFHILHHPPNVLAF